jgi:hypothetical protein
VDYLPTEVGEAFAIDQWRSQHAEPLLARQATRRQLELARRLEWLGSQAGRLHHPETVTWVRSQLEHARELVTHVQGDLERQTAQRETDRER